LFFSFSHDFSHPFQKRLFWAFNSWSDRVVAVDYLCNPKFDLVILFFLGFQKRASADSPPTISWSDRVVGEVSGQRDQSS